MITHFSPCKVSPSLLSLAGLSWERVCNLLLDGWRFAVALVQNSGNLPGPLPREYGAFPSPHFSAAVDVMFSTGFAAVPAAVGIGGTFSSFLTCSGSFLPSLPHRNDSSLSHLAPCPSEEHLWEDSEVESAGASDCCIVHHQQSPSALNNVVLETSFPLIECLAFPYPTRHHD